MDTIKGLKRSIMCADTVKLNIGDEVVVMGWANTARDIGQVVFIDLRDRSGIVQLVFENDNMPLLEKAKGIHLEYCIAARGVIRKRSNPNTKIPTGLIEILVSEVRILNKSEALPIPIDENYTIREELKLCYRYLDLRRQSLQQSLILRHRVAKLARDFFDDNGFIEIETPILTKSTPEGARDYIVPSRIQNGFFYALPQSPQLYKQLLMVSGFDRYMQIAKCFRDEDLRADRQPEFTQIDLEMSFIEADDVMEINEKFLKMLFKEIKNIDIKLPLKRIKYKDAMEQYGSDKPDTRFDMRLKDISSIVKNSEFSVFSNNIKQGGSVRAINAKGLGSSISRKDIDALTEFVKTYGAKGLAYISLTNEGIKSPILKFLKDDEVNNIINLLGAENGDIIFIVSDIDDIVLNSLGELRVHLAKKFDLIPKDTYDLLWVTEFPLLEYSEEDGRYYAKHHPFTSPMDEDIDLLDTDPSKVRAKAYDIILNGTELGGGSIRIYSNELQNKMFDMLGFTKEQAQSQFGFLLEAFKYGTPPHGGMAYGLDRLVMLLDNKQSIRDVMAFPKVQNASELMSGAPSGVNQEQLDELGIQIK